MRLILITVQIILIGIAFWGLLTKLIPTQRKPSLVRCVIGAGLLVGWSWCVTILLVGIQSASKGELAAGNILIAMMLGKVTLALYCLVVWVMGAFYLVRNVFAMPRGHGALLVVYLVLSAIIESLWRFVI